MEEGSKRVAVRARTLLLRAAALCTAAVLALCPIGAGAPGWEAALADEAGALSVEAEPAAEETPPLELTQEDRNLVERTGTLVVGLFSDRTPMSYVGDDGEPAGVTRDVLERIAQETGLSFTYVAFDSDKPIEDQVRESDIDIVAGLEPVSSSVGSIDLALSASYCSTRATVAFNAVHGYRDLDKSMVFAVTDERASAYEKLGYDVLSCPTPQACLEAVNRGEADYTYGSSHVVSYLLNRASYDNLRVVDASVQTVESVLALVEPADAELLDLLNRAIATIEPVDVIDMVYVHTYLKQDMTLHELLARHPGTLALVVAIPLAAIAAALGIVALTRSHAASRDPLTQAYNGATFRRKVRKRLHAAENGTSRCLLVVDVDDFKNVNDRFGHFEGDQVLKVCATALREASAPRGISARMGGDEFLAYWEADDAAKIQRRADETAASIAKRVAAQVPNVNVPVTVTVGGACWRNGESYDDVYRRADEALYRVKRAGKGAASIEV